MSDVWRSFFNSPVGTLQVISSREGVVAVGFLAQTGLPDERMARWLDAPEGDPLGLRPRLAAWFRGDLTALDWIPLQVQGTDLQRRVWYALRDIGPGQTTTYGALARQLGRPKAARAIGAAVGRNPVALFVPCHRVVGANGDLTGYAWGLSRKRWLLRHEGAVAPEPQLRLFRAG